MYTSYLGHLFEKYGTDKGIWGYTPAYERFMEERRKDVKKVLEVGICGYRDIPNNVVGASLFVWRDYFPHAEIYGLDNDGRFIFNDHERIHTAQCDAYTPSELHAALASMGCKVDDFDLIVDDAVHDPIPQLTLMIDLAPYLKTTGVYAMEDVCPYKIPGNTVEPMIRLMPRELQHVMEFTTHKDERLLIATR